MMFIDQEGCAWDMSMAICPKCGESATHARRVPGSGYFNCYGCNLVFDEPDWTCAESAFRGTVEA